QGGAGAVDAALLTPFVVAGQLVQGLGTVARNFGPAGVGFAGAPEGLIRSFGILQGVTERGLGVVKQETAGIVDPTRLGGRQVGPFIKRLAVNALRAAGFEEKAQEVSDRDPAFL